MKFPKIRTWVRVQWLDASQSGKWEYEDGERIRTREVSTGVFRGITDDQKMIVAPTVVIRLADNELGGVLTELEIPIGCILKIEKLPDLVLK